MTNRRHLRSGWLAVVLACWTLAGCGSVFTPSQPISYYTLTPQATAAGSVPGMADRIVAVQTARLPDYLNQNGIVTRGENNVVNVAKDIQWAGALDDNITRVIVSDLAVILGSSKVVAFPVSPALPLDRVVQVDVSRFEQGPDGIVTLAAQWTVFTDGGRSYAATDAGTYTSQPADGSYGAIAAAMSQLLVTLSHDIATTLVSTRHVPAS